MLLKKYYQCTNCEAICGLELAVQDNQVVEIRGNDNDLLSLGYICPKGVALAEMRDDPDRLRTPMVRKNGELQPASWDEAFAAIEKGMGAVTQQYGRESLAMYVGHAVMRSTDYCLSFLKLFEALGTPYYFSSDTLDALPRYLNCADMYGGELTTPVPDFDRSQYLLIIGANPMVSNGSMWIAPNFRERVKALKARSGKLVVVDPHLTRTAELADQHHFIYPGQNQHFLLALLHVIYRDNLVRTDAIAAHLAGMDQIETIANMVSLRASSNACGIDTKVIETIAHELAAAESAAVYGRLGVSLHKYGTVSNWLIDVINIVTGNLDKPGGVMFPKSPAFAVNTIGKPGIGAPAPASDFRTRVRGLPMVLGQLPIACLAEEIESPGKGQIHGLITLAGNPASSVPDTVRINNALKRLDFVLSFDIYINETSRHADVILPGAPAFEKGHFGVFSGSYVTRNVIRYSPPLFEPPEDWVSDWEAILQVIAIASGQGIQDEQGLLAMEDDMVREMLRQAAADEYSVAYGIDIDAALNQLSDQRGVDRVLDVAFRVGPYGDGFGNKPDGLTLNKIAAQPNGVDMGPLQPRIPEVLRTASGKVEVAPPGYMAQIKAILQEAARPPSASDTFLLIGRRQERSMNSWANNVPILNKGPLQCTLQVHPDDAQRLSLQDGKPAKIRTKTGEIEAPVEITDNIMPGVVCFPHGWGQNLEGMAMNLAQQKAGVNVNCLTNEMDLDTLSGTAALNAVPVHVSAVYPEPRAGESSTVGSD